AASSTDRLTGGGPPALSRSARASSPTHACPVSYRSGHTSSRRPRGRSARRRAISPPSVRPCTPAIAASALRREPRHRAPVEARRGLGPEVDDIAPAAVDPVGEVVQLTAGQAPPHELGDAFPEERARSVHVAVGEMLEAHRHLDEALQGLALHP